MQASPHPNLFLLVGNDRDFSIDWSCRYFRLGFAEAYFDAARILIERFRDETPHDFQTIPLMFLFRHFAELAMKECMMQALALARSLDPSFDPSVCLKEVCEEHNLSVLLASLRKLHAHVCKEDESAEVPFMSQTCQRHIEELSERDPKSFTFRYWSLNKRTGQFPQTLIFNLDVLLAGMEQIRAELTELSHTTEITTDQINDYLQDYQEDVNQEFQE